MSIEVVKFDVEGMSSLLMHNPAGSMVANAGGVKVKPQIPTPEEEAARSVYADEHGAYYIPAVAFRNALLAAGTGKKIGKMSAIKAMSAGVFNAETRSPIFDPRTKKPIKAHRVHSVRVVIPSSKAAVIRGRAEVPAWATKVAFEVDTDFITVQQVAELFALAGRMIGVLDWRPQNKGPHGRFKVK